MRVLVEYYEWNQGLETFHWIVDDDYLVLSETKTHYQIEKVQNEGIFKKRRVVYTAWVSKDGAFTRCQVVKGWKVN